MTADAVPPSSSPLPHDVSPAWHALPVDAVLTALGTDDHLGLSHDEVDRRLQRHGPNALPQATVQPAWLRFVRQLHNPLIYVLLASALIALLLRSYVDAGVIAGVVLINALIGHIQQGKAQRALEAVRELLAAQATVLRHGERHRIAAQDLVPGDIVLLEAGDKLGADLRLTRAHNLRTSEASLTGESTPVDKITSALAPATALAERRCMGYAGTMVIYGQGQGVVVATAAATEMGHIGSMVGELSELATPLTRRLDQFARQVTGFILLVSLLTLAYGYWVASMPVLDLFLAVVGLAVAAIPEGMPAVVTIVLAMGTRVMARKQAIVRRLPAVEALGSVSVICTDKTGTLTHNAMTVVRVVLPRGEWTVTGAGYAPEGGFFRDAQPLDATQDDALQALALAAMLCNDASLTCDDNGHWSMVGDPTEGALLTLARKAGLDPTQGDLRYTRIDTIAFDSDRQYMASLHHDHQGHHVVMLKGAPERVLALCTHQGGGAPVQTAHWQAEVERMARAGQRVLALARCDWPTDRTEITTSDMTARFELLGLVGIMDPPREDAMTAIAECQRAGIRVKMITGDHATTAAAIGAQLGLAADHALTGAAIDAMDDKALAQAVTQTDVFARATPEHKLRLVAALQAQGHLVAMTGDGVNDAPALKAANIGVAMGQQGTDAAREASDLVLTDDHFATIARAVREGRVVYDNIKKSLMHMLPTNGGEAGVLLLAIFAGLPLPVTAGQILWVNTVTAVTLALALAFEPAEKGVMALPPRPPQEPIITRALGLRILFVIGLIIAATFAVFQWELSRGSSLAEARTSAVNMIVFCDMVYLFNVRHFTAHAFRWETFSGNRVVLLVVALLALLQLLFTYSPVMQHLFASAPLDAASWLFILAVGTALFLAVEAEKALLRRASVHRI